MRYGMDDFVGVGTGGNLVSSPVADQFTSPADVTAVDLTTADGPSDLTLPGHLTGTATIGSVYGFNLTAGVTYSFAERPTATGGVQDAYLRLLDSSGHQITFDDDGGAGHSSLLTFTPTAPGTYYLAAGSWENEFAGGHDTGSLTLDVWTSNDPDAGSTTATAMAINVGTTFGQLSSGSDVDVYQINLTQGGTYTFNFSGGYDGYGETGDIATMSLLDSAGHVVASNLNYESAFSFLADQGGTYYVRLNPYANTQGGYTLDVNKVNPGDYDPLDAIRWTTANNIQTHDVDGVPTATIYFGAAGENFGQVGDDGKPMVTLGWTPTEISAVLNALNTNYSPITGIHYVQTMTQTGATFRLATDHSTQYGAYMDPQDPAYGASQGVGVFNVDSGAFPYGPGLQQGGFSYAVILHEFGHGHGLAHPHDNGGGSDVMLGVNGSSGPGTYGVFDLNQGVYTVMSYNDGWPLDPDGPQPSNPLTASSIAYGWSGSLGAFDIAALQERYGVHAYNTGDNVYQLPDHEGPGTFYQTIWDTGGNDTIAYSGTGNAQIDLLAATLDYTPTGGGVISYAQGIHGGFTIANGVVIENATGGSGNDALLGNSADNTLTGNAGNDTLMGREGNDLLVGGVGNDTLDGGVGIDTASYAAAGTGVTINLGSGTATGGDGSDGLTSIENVIGSAFQDRIVGDAGDNTIKAGNGIDVVTLGAGNDVFVAEQGTKVSTKAGSLSWDVITDFNGNGDLIDLSGLGTTFHFDGSSANKDAGDLTFKVYTSITGAENALGIDIHDQPGASGISGPVTVVFGNNADGGSPDFALVLLNTNGVDQNDFIWNATAHHSLMAALSTTISSAHGDYLFA